jgi:hypothetical protein
MYIASQRQADGDVSSSTRSVAPAAAGGLPPGCHQVKSAVPTAVAARARATAAVAAVPAAAACP